MNSWIPVTETPRVLAPLRLAASRALKASAVALLVIAAFVGIMRLTGCGTYYGYYLPPSSYIPSYCRMHEAKVDAAESIATYRPLKKYEAEELAKSRLFVKEQCS